MYTCSEVAKCISSDEYLRAGLLKKVGIRVHVLMCRHCQRYLDQLKTLTAKLRTMKDEVPPSEIEAAKKRILERISRKR